MLLWLALALMTGAAVFAVLWPLGRSRPVGLAPDSTDTAFYKAQLAEIESDAERGLIDADEVETARVEAARRLLAATRRDVKRDALASATMRRRAAALLTIVSVPLVSISLYTAVGSPGTPDQPLLARADRGRPDTNMAGALARIEEHLSRNPDDGRGFEVVGPVYMAQQRYQDAVRAWSSAIRLQGQSAHRLESLGEAQVAAAEGIVTAAARESLDRALALDPKLMKARYYRGIAAEQDGDKARAIGLFSELVVEAPPGSPLRNHLSEKITALGGTPPQGAADALAALPDADRMAAIRGMVDSLAGRLAADGSDVEGWLRLVRSYMVLGDEARAREAFVRGRSALAADPAGRERLELLARELKIQGS